MTFDYRDNPPRQPYSHNVPIRLDAEDLEGNAGLIRIPSHLHDVVHMVMGAFLDLFGHYLDHPDCAAAVFDDEGKPIIGNILDVEAFVEEHGEHFDDERLGDTQFVVNMFTMAGVATTDVFNVVLDQIRDTND